MHQGYDTRGNSADWARHMRLCAGDHRADDRKAWDVGRAAPGAIFSQGDLK